MKSLNVDTVIEDRRRAVHRIIRAMNDGACPSCGYMSDREEFARENGDLECLSCGFTVTEQDQQFGQDQFLEIMSRSLDVFEVWRERGWKHI